MRAWMPLIHEEFVYSGGEKNITEWCKNKACWARIQSMDLPFEDDFEKELIKGQPLPTVGPKARNGETQTLSPEERDRQAKVMQLDGEPWAQIISWMKNDKENYGNSGQLFEKYLQTILPKTRAWFLMLREENVKDKRRF